MFHFSLPLPLRFPHPLDRAFSHKNRPICHFKFVGKSVFFLLKLHRGVTLSVFNPWHGRFLAPEDA